VNDEDVGGPVFRRGLGVENGGEGGGEREQEAAGIKVADESVHNSPRCG
jgi:hypothetical protein